VRTRMVAAAPGRVRRSSSNEMSRRSINGLFLPVLSNHAIESLLSSGTDGAGIQTIRVHSSDTHIASTDTYAPPDFGSTLRSGQPLQADVRGEMESRFKRDLGDVRIHTDPQAAMSAELRNANAYAIGRDIAFGPGKFDPDGSEGRRLLAHELTHVLQQSAGGGLSANAPAMESEADRVSGEVAFGGSAEVIGSAGVGVACDEKDGQKPKLDFYQTAFYANRAWAQGKGEGVKTPEGWPVDVGLSELWAKIDLHDETNAPHSEPARQFADYVKMYQTNIMGRSGPLANGVVDAATAESLRKIPFTRTGVTTADPHPPTLADKVGKIKQAGRIARVSPSVGGDSLGPVGDKIIDLLAIRLAGEEIAALVGLDKSLKQRMIASALRGFIAEMQTQIVTQKKGERFEARMKELLTPVALLDFSVGYGLGATAGVISPVTDLIGLTALADVMPKVAAKLGGKLAHLAGEADALSAEANKLRDDALKIAIDLFKHPDQMADLIEGMKGVAVDKAGELGHGAAAKVVGLFESPWEDKKEEEEEKDPGWKSVIPESGDAWQALLPGGAATMALGTAGRAFNYGSGKLKDALITTPWQKVGYAIGHVIGMVVINVVILVFSSGIGNLIVEMSAALGKLAPALKTLSTAVGAIGKAIAAVESGIGVVFGAVIKKIKPLEALMKPLGGFLERLAKFLRRILGIAEKEAAPLVTSAGSNLLPDAAAGTKVVPKPSPPAPPLPKPRAGAPAQGAGDAARAAPKPPPTATVKPPPAADVPAKPAAVTAPPATSGGPGAATSEAAASKTAPTTATPAKPAAPETLGGKRIDLPRDRPRPPSPYKFKKDAPKVTDINQGKAAAKPPTVPHEQPVPVQKAEPAAVDAQVQMKKASGDFESHGGSVRDRPPSPVSSVKKPPPQSQPAGSQAPRPIKPLTSAPQQPVPATKPQTVPTGKKSQPVSTPATPVPKPAPKPKAKKVQPSATQPAPAQPAQAKPQAKPRIRKPKQPATPPKKLDERIADAEAAVNESRKRVVEYKAGRVAGGQKPKGGPYKDLYNKKETLFVLKRAKAFPNRQILEQAEITHIKSPDGTLRSASKIAGEGRIPDMVEINGAKVTGTDLKSSHELINSIEGGVKNPTQVEGTFGAGSKVGKQHAKEDSILKAMSEGDKLIIRGRDVRTGQSVTIEVDAKNYGSEVLTYEDLLPN
jgi:hypothetical protein